jgi:hypothetical protein
LKTIAIGRFPRDAVFSKSVLLRYTGLARNMVCMRQLNLNVTPEFERDLRTYMKSRSISRKPEAIRQALREGVARSGNGSEYDFRSWLGLGLRAPLRRRRRFLSED